MGISAEVALAAANSYTEETVEGAGAIKGKNCIITSITEITGGHRVNFQWTLDNGTVQTDTMDVMDGVNGTNGRDGRDGTDGSQVSITQELETGTKIATVTIDSVDTDLYAPAGGGGGSNPTGTVISFFGETAPEGYLVCDGTAYNKADYTALSTHLLALTDHSAYEVQGDNTKFKVPDLRGEFLRGAGTNSHDYGGAGAKVGVHQAPTLLQRVSVGTTKVNGVKDAITTNADYTEPTTSSDVVGANHSSISGVPVTPRYTVRPTNTSVLYCIKY